VDITPATWFRWSGWEESGEYAGVPNGWTVGAKQTGYVPGLAAYAGADPATADWRFNLNDHLGSPRQMLGQNKAAKARFDFAPYGELMRSAGLPLTVGYTGHRWDPAIGQYFAPFRYYNPQTARWNMRDPLGMVDGPNVYAYVTGNPVNALDELGLSDWFTEWGACMDDSGENETLPVPNGLSFPVWRLPKLPHAWRHIKPLRPYTRPSGGTPWTTPASILRNTLRKTPLDKFVQKPLRILSKTKLGPWFIIADGALAYYRMGRCALKTSDWIS
jgi:RHS repeat-associated protein